MHGLRHFSFWLHIDMSSSPALQRAKPERASSQGLLQPTDVSVLMQGQIILFAGFVSTDYHRKLIALIDTTQGMFKYIRVKIYVRYNPTMKRPREILLDTSIHAPMIGYTSIVMRHV